MGIFTYAVIWNYPSVTAEYLTFIVANDRSAHSSTWSTSNRLHVWEGGLLCGYVLEKCKLLLCKSWFWDWRAAFVWGGFCSVEIIVILKDLVLGWNTSISPSVSKTICVLEAQHGFQLKFGLTHIAIISMCFHSSGIYVVAVWVGPFYRCYSCVNNILLKI